MHRRPFEGRHLVMMDILTVWNLITLSAVVLRPKINTHFTGIYSHVW